MKTIVLVTNIASPYRIYLFNEFSAKLKKSGIKLHVVFYEHMNKIRSWTVNEETIHFSYKFFKSKGFGFRNRIWYVNPSIYTHVLNQNPDIIILGATWNYIDYIRYYMNKHLRKKLILWTEINEFKRSDPNLVKMIRNFVYSKFNTFIVPGVSSMNYLEEHGINREFIRMPNLINEHYFKYPESIRRTNREVLIVSRIIPIKQIVKTVKVLIKAVEERNESVNITVIGEGTMENKLKALIKDKPYIVYIPRVEYEDMSTYYNKSDIFILNSVYDPSPLSIIEAIRTGNIMLVSNVAGNAVEVVREGVNGFTIDPYNENDLRNKFENILDWSEDMIGKAKQASVRIYAEQFESAKWIKYISDFILKKIDFLS